MSADEKTCLNCETVLAGGWCFACGQRADIHAPALRHVLFEWVEIPTHADSRLWRTLRRLAVDPARLSRDYMERRPATEIPPMRIFVVMVVLIFAVSSLIGHHGSPPAIGVDRGALAAGLRRLHLQPEIAAWLQARLLRAAAHPGAVLDVMREWSERFAFLMLPLATILLSLIFIADRRVVACDHAIFSLHSLSFALLVLTLLAVLDTVVGDAAMLLLLAVPVHLFVHLRGVCRTGRLGTVLRIGLLGVGSGFGILVLTAVLALLGLQLADV